MKQSFIQNSVLEFPDEVDAHMYSFLTTAELELFGKANAKTYKNTKAAAFLRKVHSVLREGLVFKTIKQHKKHCIALEGIVAKLSTLGDAVVSQNFLTSLDTSSLENFNHSMQWMEDHNDDVDWLHILIPHPNSDVPQLPWTDDELELIDLWHDQHQNRYEYYLKMGW